MTRIAELQEKIDLCISCALRCETEWSMNYWKSVADKLEQKLNIEKIKDR